MKRIDTAIGLISPENLKYLLNIGLLTMLDNYPCLHWQLIESARLAKPIQVWSGFLCVIDSIKDTIHVRDRSDFDVVTSILREKYTPKQLVDEMIRVCSDKQSFKSTKKKEPSFDDF